jgi:PmbA protein
LDLQALNETAIKIANNLGVDDAIALSAGAKENMLRFANNSATVVKTIDEAQLMVYIGKSRRRAIASTSNLEESDVKRFVRELFESLKGLPQGEYVPLPDKALKFGPKGSVQDKKLDGAGTMLPDLATRAISSSLKAGGKRAAGVILVSKVNTAILTTSGTKGTDSRGSITLNIRAFGANDSSGHGLSCSSTMAGFDPEEAGTRAGSHAKRMETASEPEPGTYSVLLSPTVASNITETVSGAASAFSVDAGTSYLAEKLGKKVAAESFTLTDHGSIRGGFGGRVFDDEGAPTGSTKIIEKGVLGGYLHNLTTAKKWKVGTTGNAGIIDPRAWNLEVGAGDSSYEEMVKEMKRGIVLTSNWYTRFKNYRTGEFSTVPRDGAYLVENGKVMKPLKGMRLSDDLLRMFSQVRLLSKNREWIEWWEVDTPTLCPWILVDGAKITKAYE